MKKFGLLWVAVCVVAAVATACGGSETPQKSDSGTATATASPTATGGPTTPSAALITIANMKFGAPITVPPGAQVTIRNDDSAEHSVTSDTAGQFDVDVEAKQQGTLTAPSSQGEYKFHCTYHPSMHGTLIVK